MENNFKSELNKYISEMEEYTKSIGVNYKNIDWSKVDDIVSISVQDIKNKTKEEIAEYGLILSQYIYFLQNKYNECDSFIKWYNYNKRKFFDNDIDKANDFYKRAELRMTRIIFLTRKLENVYNAINNIAKFRS